MNLRFSNRNCTQIAYSKHDPSAEKLKNHKNDDVENSYDCIEHFLSFDSELYFAFVLLNERFPMYMIG